MMRIRSRYGGQWYREAAWEQVREELGTRTTATPGDRDIAVTCDNVGIPTTTFQLHRGFVMPKIGRALAHIVRHPAASQPPAPRPWEWERLATDQERDQFLLKTDISKAA
jgi:hypothetical protein